MASDYYCQQSSAQRENSNATSVGVHKIDSSAGIFGIFPMGCLVLSYFAGAIWLGGKKASCGEVGLKPIRNFQQMSLR